MPSDQELYLRALAQHQIGVGLMLIEPATVLELLRRLGDAERTVRGLNANTAWQKKKSAEEA